MTRRARELDPDQKRGGGAPYPRTKEIHDGAQPQADNRAGVRADHTPQPAARGDSQRRRARTRRTYASVAGATPDLGDEAVADLLSDVAEAEVTRDLGELRLLGAALKRVSDGTYGECIDCGTEIPFERLRAQPGAERCFACQGRHEKTYKA
jgi:DnaK suppressor protein